MTLSKKFLQITGAAGLAAGVITLAIVILPQLYGAPASLSDRLALHANPLYQLRQWLSFLNVFAILTAMWGMAAHRLEDAPGAASTGMVFLFFYGAAELLGRSAMIFAREYRWMHALGEAEGPRRAELLTLIEGFDAVWAGWFVLILLTFVLSAFLIGWSARGDSGLQRAASWSLLAAAALGTLTLVAQFLPAFQATARWAYVIIQPASRLLVGSFLISEARKTNGRGDW